MMERHRRWAMAVRLNDKSRQFRIISAAFLEGLVATDARYGIEKVLEFTMLSVVMVYLRLK